MTRCTRALAAALVAGAAVAAGGGSVGAQVIGPLVQTGDIDLLEDVLEHVSAPVGDGSRTVHQMYDSGGAAAD